ncbi:MAG TPA: 4Fe-4S binding protein [Desulfonatronum sp.]|nr:4Fe-4S binding protein [Desulfonatronum sp.]
MISVQRLIQAISLFCFLALLWLAAFPLPDWAPVDAFLRMDPLVLLGTVFAARSWIPGLGLSFLILAATAILGRFFCGYLCPMGTTLDLTDRLFRPKHNDPANPARLKQSNGLRRIKYLLLFFLAGIAALGVSAVFIASPLSLITRFYAMLVHPLAALTSDGLLHLIRPLALHQDWTWAAYAEIPRPRFSTQWFVLTFFLGIFALAWFSPRFWCRYLCPSGAILALVGRKPLMRRMVADACTRCDACRQSCPMDAITVDPRETRHDECIACLNCVRACPVDAISFGSAIKPVRTPDPFLPRRREALLAGLAGVGAATLTLTGLAEVRGELLPGNPMPPDLLRPPGALPERTFLARCIRCGLCMRACPTNTLQPLWLQAGVVSLFSPGLMPRRGPCLPECTTCGDVCPTGAIPSLPLFEKQWAKIGTAHILRHKCLAWEWEKECLVCDEVCPYDAIELRKIPEVGVSVPFVRGNQCSGCGFCEYHCPVRAASAIVVEPMEALRLDSGSYKQTGQAIGLRLNIDPKDKAFTAVNDNDSMNDDMTRPAPGFTF